MRNWVINDFATKTSTRGFIRSSQRRFVGLASSGLYFAELKLAAPCDGVKVIPFNAFKGYTVSGNQLVVSSIDGSTRKFKFESSSPHQWKEAIDMCLNSSPEEIERYLSANQYDVAPAQSRPAFLPTTQVDAATYRPNPPVQTGPPSQTQQYMQIQMPGGSIPASGGPPQVVMPAGGVVQLNNQSVDAMGPMGRASQGPPGAMMNQVQQQPPQQPPQQQQPPMQMQQQQMAPPSQPQGPPFGQPQMGPGPQQPPMAQQQMQQQPPVAQKAPQQPPQMGPPGAQVAQRPPQAASQPPQAQQAPPQGAILASHMVRMEEEHPPMHNQPASEAELMQMGFTRDPNTGLWCDMMFKADPTCVFGHTPTPDEMEFFQNTVVQFGRPSQIHPNPQLIVDGFDSSDIRQGALPDCWLLSALACVAEYPELFRNIISHMIPGDLYTFHLYDAGRWNRVIVDGFLPVGHDGQPAFAKCDEGEFYVPLIEKAAAKLTRCYTALDGGRIENALVMFTGGVPELVTWKNGMTDQSNPTIQKRQFFDPDFIWNNYVSAMRPATEVPNPPLLLSASLGSCGEQKLDCGIVAGHGYSVIGGFVTPDGTRLVQLRNPWKGFEWNGSWSDNDPRWTPQLMAMAGHQNCDDGIFFMSIEDFGAIFDEMSGCHLPVPGVRPVHKGTARWSIADGTAAGEASNDNPVFCIDVPQEACGPDGKSTLILGMSQHIGGDIEPTYILSLIRNHMGDIVGPDPSQRTFKNLEHLGYRLTLEPGKYFIVASTADAGIEREFSLRLIAQPAIQLYRLDNEAASKMMCFTSVWFKANLQEPLPIGYGQGVPVAFTVSCVGDVQCQQVTAVVVDLRTGMIVSQRSVGVTPGVEPKITLEADRLMPGSYLVTAYTDGPRGLGLSLTTSAVSKGTLQVTADVKPEEIGFIANSWY